METSGLSWLALVTCALVAGISLGMMLCAIAGCLRVPPPPPPPPSLPRALADDDSHWIAVAHPGGEVGVGYHPKRPA